MIPWASPTSQSKWHHDRFSCFRTGDSRVFLYFTMGVHLPQSCPLSWRHLDCHLIHGSLGQPESSTQPLLHRWPQSVPILYNGMPLSPSKLPRPLDGSEPPSNTWFLGPTRVLNPTASRSEQPFLQGSSVCQTDRQTDRPRYSVGNNRPHLCK